LYIIRDFSLDKAGILFHVRLLPPEKLICNKMCYIRPLSYGKGPFVVGDLSPHAQSSKRKEGSRPNTRPNFSLAE